MPVEIRVPQLGESVVEATVARWHKKEGDPVAPGDVLVELETDKVNVEVPADQAGVLQQIAAAEGSTVAIGAVLATIGESAPAAAAPPLASTAPETAVTADRNGAGAIDVAEAAATPIARRVAEDSQVDLKMVKGTGPAGRVTKDDVAQYVQSREAAPTPSNGGPKPSAPSTTAPASAAARPAAPTPAPVTGGSSRPEQRVPMSRRRQTIATRLVEAQHTAAMLTTFNEIDMTAVMELRNRRRESFEKTQGVKLGFMSFFTKATVGALRAFPLLNAEIQGNEIVKKGYYDIGIAVGAEEGLVVPVVRDADKLTFAGIEKQIGDLAKRARENKLTLPELQGGTFTITNGGVFGSLMSTPILNAPQVGILGLHKTEERPVVRDKQIVIRPMMYVALSYDHRIVDGSEAVRFLVRIKELIEDPETLLLEG